jgi:hypothetical protein
LNFEFGALSDSESAAVRLACLIHAASVHPGPGSNPQRKENGATLKTLFNFKDQEETPDQFLTNHLIYPISTNIFSFFLSF